MKSLSFLSILLLPAALSASVKSDSIPHFDLEMSSAEYREALSEISHPKDAVISAEPALQAILDVGKRNLDWIEAINRARPEDGKLELSTPATQTAIPIDRPLTYNREILLREYGEAKAEVPAEMAAVLFGTGPLPATHPLADDVAFLASARKIDRSYQRVSRWILLQPYLSQLADRAPLDIRGYYFLSREPELEAKLGRWQSADSAADRARLTPWLLGQCRNSRRATATCTRDLDASVRRSGNALDFYRQHLPVARQVYEGFFRIANVRTDVTWNGSAPDVFSIPFREPNRREVHDWLQSNIEDEWRLGTWNLRLDFRTGSAAMPYVVFEAGATPNVERLAGNKVTMDANRALDEYSTRWTIRHEFGHVLGVPDCYVEFYDVDQRVIINYQIDIDNLMCSRKGKLQQIHYDELRRVYWRN